MSAEGYRWEIYQSREELAQGSAMQIAAQLEHHLSAKGTASLAVPGGSTPEAMLRRLGETDIDWERIVVTLTDERRVPADSERSNQQMVQGTLFAGRAEAARFVPLRREGLDQEAEMEAVCAGLDQEALPLCVAVLGMGDDMHTASLFPGSEGLDAALADDAPPALAVSSRAAAELRITLSVRTLAAAERHLLITGEGKRQALKCATEIGDPRQAPVCAVVDGATVHWAP